MVFYLYKMPFIPVM